MNMQALMVMSAIYTEALKEQIDRFRSCHHPDAHIETKTKATRCTLRRVGPGSDDEGDGDEPPKRVCVLASGAKPAFVQPALLTGATLRDYYLLEGVAWMVSLWENGISGILRKYWLKLPVSVAGERTTDNIFLGLSFIFPEGLFKNGH